MVAAKPITHLGPLSRWELASIGAAFAGLFPRDVHADLPLCADDLDVGPALQSLLAVAPARAVWGVRAAIVLCALAPIFVLGRVRTLSGVDASAKTLVMAALLASSFYPVRQLAMLVKMMGSFLFGRAPQVREAMLRARVVPVPTESGTRLIGVGSLVRRPQQLELVHDNANDNAQSMTGASNGRRIA